jgi:cytochrome c biogenesis protein CcdA
MLYQPQSIVSAGNDPLVILALGLCVTLVLAEWPSRRVRVALRTVAALAGTATAFAIIYWPCWLPPFCDGSGGW